MKRKPTLMEAMLVIAVILFIFVVIVSYQEQKQWEQFSATHNCRVVSQQQGQSITGFAGGDYVSLNQRAQTGWLCNDGVTYWR